MRLTSSGERVPVSRWSRTLTRARASGGWCDLHRGNRDRCGRRQDPLRWPPIPRLDVGVPYLRLLGPNGPPVLLRQQLQRGGEQDVLLLEKHLPDGGRHGPEDGLHPCPEVLHILPWARLQQRGQRLPAAPDVVVDGPHHCGRAGEALPLQVREQEVLLAAVVLLVFPHLRQAPSGLFQAGGIGGGLQERLYRFLKTVQHPRRGVVLRPEGVDGVAGDGLRLLLGLQGFPKDGDMDVAEPLDLHFGKALVYQRLLNLGDLRGPHVPQERGELRLHLVHRPALVQLPDDVLQGFFSLLSVVDVLAHGTPSCGQLLAVAPSRYEFTAKTHRRERRERRDFQYCSASSVVSAIKNPFCSGVRYGLTFSQLSAILKIVCK
jgi:hypothetical protein